MEIVQDFGHFVVKIVGLGGVGDHEIHDGLTETRDDRLGGRTGVKFEIRKGPRMSREQPIAIVRVDKTPSCGGLFAVGFQKTNPDPGYGVALDAAYPVEIDACRDHNESSCR